MAEDSDEEKTEEPTAQRLEKAREEGQVARSRELTTFLLLASGIGGMWLSGGWFVEHLFSIARRGLSFPPNVARDPAAMLGQVIAQFENFMLALAPFFLIVMVAALVAPSLLGGWLFSGKSIKLDVSRLDAIKGLSRVFSSNALAELAKAIAKSVLIGAVAAMFIRAHLGEILELAHEESAHAIAHALRLVFMCVALMVLVFIVVVAIDVPFQVWHHKKKLRMSTKEIKDEHKENEGNPEVKAKLHAERQRLARSRMMAAVPDADVVVTNPQHFAVALAYDGATMAAPRVVAKGADEIAKKIRELGAANNVPQLAAPPLARALYRHAPLEAEIPAALYTAVAEVLAWVYQLDQAARGQADRPTRPVDIAVPEAWQVPPDDTST